MITNNDAEPLKPTNNGQVGPTQPVQPIDAAEAERFANLKKGKTEESQAADAQAEAELTPEELQRQIREGMFKSGFNKAIERAREIAKEMKG